MPGQIAVLRDKDGIVHHMARDSKVAREGLADGSLVDVEEESHAPADAEDRDDLDAGTVVSGSGDGELPTRNSDDGDKSSVAQPTARR